MGKHAAVAVSESRQARQQVDRRPAPSVVVSDPGASVFARRTARRARLKFPLAFVAFAASAGFFLVNIVDPYSGAVASPNFQAHKAADPYFGQPVQTITVAEDSYRAGGSRDSFTVTNPTPPPPPPPPAPVAPAQSASGSGSSATESSSGSSSSGSQAAGSSAAESQPAAQAPSAGTPDPGSAKAIARQMLADRGMGDDQYSCLVSLWNRESGWNVNASNGSSGAYGIPQALPGSKMASAGPDWQSNAATQISWGLGYITGRYGTPCGAWGHSENFNWY